MPPPTSLRWNLNQQALERKDIKMKIYTLCKKCICKQIQSETLTLLQGVHSTSILWMIISFKWKGREEADELGGWRGIGQEILSFRQSEFSPTATKLKLNIHHNQVQMHFFNLKLSVFIISTVQHFSGIFCHVQILQMLIEKRFLALNKFVRSRVSQR